jgi:shikimate kinase
MKNIVLIGMPASGKSTLGVVLAKALGMDFVDTDLLIQRAHGKRLQDIIQKKGLKAFSAIEEETLSGLELENSVISTGGSAVYSEKAMMHLKKNGCILYLHVPFNEIQRRLRNITTRGIVMSPGTTLKQLYDERLPLYQHYADMVIHCTGKNLEQCVDDIVRRLTRA